MSILKRKITNKLIEKLQNAGACSTELNILKNNWLNKTIGEALRSEDALNGDWICWICTNLEARKLFSLEERKEMCKVSKTDLKLIFITEDSYIVQNLGGEFWQIEEQPYFIQEENEWNVWGSIGCHHTCLGIGRINPEAHKYCRKVKAGTTIKLRVLRNS